MKWWVGGLVCAVALAGCSGDEPKNEGSATATEATPTAERSPEATATTVPDGPTRKTYARGEAVDIERGVLFLDPKTGGGEAWADVGASPSGMFVAWNGDGTLPPVLFETDTYQKIEIDTAGMPGTVLDYSLDGSEVSVRAGDELLIASTDTGEVRLRFALDPTAVYLRATWGPAGQVAVTQAAQGLWLGILAWTGSEMKHFEDVPVNWAHWSPDGKTIAASGIPGSPQPWLALIDVASGDITRIDEALYNPRWSESGDYVEGQLLSGELLVYRADGTPHMRMNGVCALLGTPWIGDEIATWGFGEDVRVAMDGTVRPYEPAFLDSPSAELRPDGGVALLDRFRGTNVLAELDVTAGVSVTFRSSPEGVRSLTPDGRAIYALGGGAKGWCENVGTLEVELL